MSSDKEANTLLKLVSINKDASNFYSSASTEAKDAQLKKTFHDLETLHNGIAVNIQKYVRGTGNDADANGTVTGQVSQFWGEMMAKISNDVDETLVSHLEEAEDRCLHSIEDAMKEKEITPAAKSLLQSELVALRKSHDYMKALKEMTKAA